MRQRRIRVVAKPARRSVRPHWRHGWGATYLTRANSVVPETGPRL